MRRVCGRERLCHEWHHRLDSGEESSDDVTMRRGNAPGLIGMLHIPINTIAASPVGWRRALGLPDLTGADWRIVESMPPPGLGRIDGDGDEGLERPERLTVFSYLVERMLHEARIYLDSGFAALMLENVAGPYFIRHHQPPFVYWVMRALASRLRAAFPDTRLGIQILSHSDDWAMDIACRLGFAFVRSESALFEGLRPEGRTPNTGNLARLYMERQRMLAGLGDDRPEPAVLVDVRKKHTVFGQELGALRPWLDTILFQKLEGVVVTGAATGSPVHETDLLAARQAIEETAARAEASTGTPWRPLLVVGSGVSVDNVATSRKHADAAIVGSSLKRGGYWECPVDESRVRALADAWMA